MTYRNLNAQVPYEYVCINVKLRQNWFNCEKGLTSKKFMFQQKFSIKVIIVYYKRTIMYYIK